MNMKQKMGIVLISVILLSATAFAAPAPAAKTMPAEKLKAAFTVTYNKKMPMMVKFTDKVWENQLSGHGTLEIKLRL